MGLWQSGQRIPAPKTYSEFVIQESHTKIPHMATACNPPDPRGGNLGDSARGDDRRHPSHPEISESEYGCRQDCRGGRESHEFPVAPRANAHWFAVLAHGIGYPLVHHRLQIFRRTLTQAKHVGTALPVANAVEVDRQANLESARRHERPREACRRHGAKVAQRFIAQSRMPQPPSPGGRIERFNRPSATGI